MTFIESITRKNIKELEPYSSARSVVSEAKMFLDANELPYQYISSDLLSENMNRYPEPQPKELVAKLAELNGVASSQIIVGRGLDEILECLFKAFLNPNEDTVVVTPPTYGYYNVLANIYGVGTEEVCLDRNDFSLSAEKFQSLSSNSKVIFLCTPNNPTGNLLTRESIEEIAKNNSDKLIAIDEAYIDFSSERGNNSQTGNMGLISKYPNIIILRTLSKAYGAAGVRFGYGVASTDVIEVLKKVIAPYPIPRPCVSIIRKVLESEEKIKCLVEDIIVQRKFLEEKLSNLSFVHRVFPSDANFLLVKVSDSKLLCKELAGLGIILRDRSSQVNLENCVRISVGNKEENANLILALMQFQLRSEKRGE